MSNAKTTFVGVLKLLAAIAYVVFKQMHNVPLTDADIGIITLAVGGAAGNILSSDAKKETP